MNIVDSSAWLEYFADGPNAKHFATPLKDATSLVVPVVSIYEVFGEIGTGVESLEKTDNIANTISFIKTLRKGGIRNGCHKRKLHC